MTNRFRVSSALIRRLEDVGLRPLVVLRQAGLPMGLLDQEKILVTTEELFSFTAGFLKSAVIPPLDSSSGLKNG